VKKRRGRGRGGPIIVVSCHSAVLFTHKRWPCTFSFPENQRGADERMKGRGERKGKRKKKKRGKKFS